MNLRLRVPSLRADWSEQRTILEKHARHQGMQRTFASFKPVRMVFIQREVGSPALEHDARSIDQDARTEVEIDALNKRGGIAVGVDRTEINGVSGKRGIANPGMRGVILLPEF